MAKKPIKKIKLVEITFWDCGVDDHAHKSEGACLSCIERQPKTRRPDTRKRDVEVFLYALQGHSSEDVVEKFELSSTQRVLDIVRHHAIKIWLLAADRGVVWTSSCRDPLNPWLLAVMRDFRRDSEKWLELHNQYYPGLNTNFLKSK